MVKSPELRMSYANLQDFAMDLADGLGRRALSSNAIETPALSGSVVADAVRPGLVAAGLDLSFRQNASIDITLERCVMCCMVHSGVPQRMELLGHGPVPLSIGGPVILGVGETMICRHQVPVGRQISGGFMLTSDFLDRFDDTIADGGTRALRCFVEPGVQAAALPYSAQVHRIASQNLKHPYTGTLAQLFLESNALRYIVEIATMLREENMALGRIGRKNYDGVVSVRDMIDRSLIDPPKIVDMAKLIGTNVTTLQANFKLVFGKTIFTYVRDQRLNMARILIVDYGLSVSEAGYRVGYSSPSAFTAAYRRHFGHPPSEERRSTRP